MNPDDRRTMTPLFLAALLTALGLAVYLYLIEFDNLSEVRLVTLSPLWVILLAFGLSGLLAEKAAALVADGDAADMVEGMHRVGTVSPLIYFVFLGLPRLIANPARLTSSPLGIAGITALCWAVLLYVFFLVLWPSL